MACQEARKLPPPCEAGRAVNDIKLRPVTYRKPSCKPSLPMDHLSGWRISVFRSSPHPSRKGSELSSKRAPPWESATDCQPPQIAPGRVLRPKYFSPDFSPVALQPRNRNAASRVFSTRSDVTSPPGWSAASSSKARMKRCLPGMEGFAPHVPVQWTGRFNLRWDITKSPATQILRGGKWPLGHCCSSSPYLFHRILKKPFGYCGRPLQLTLFPAHTILPIVLMF
jgi:hypothetical protein